MVSDNEGFLYPETNMSICVNCELCKKTCPIITKQISINTPTAYACINKDENIRLQSSSGGVFTLLAENTINNGGIVFGAKFDDDFNLVHSYTETLDGISDFRGSKYVQSDIGETYKIVKCFLDSGKKVLFTGTPCQIGGLTSYLKKGYENLLCVDLICHGVPSPMVFKKYRLELENRYGSKVQLISFRRKDYGWNLFSIFFRFNNGKEYIEPLSKDIFMQGFLNDLYLRPSCYACNFKTLNRQSDISLADFWGVERILPEFNDNKGTSLIFVNSKKGEIIFKNLQDKMISTSVEVEKAIEYNTSAIKSVTCNHKRKSFFKNFSSNTWEISKLIKKYLKISISKRIYSRIIILLSKVKRKIFK